MNRELRPIVTGVATCGLAVDALAETIEEPRPARAKGEIRKRVFEPEPAEFPGSMRQDVDARAHRPDLGCRLVDARGYAGLVQSQRQGQSADTGAYDNCFHAHQKCVAASDYRMDATFPHAVARGTVERRGPILG